MDRRDLLRKRIDRLVEKGLLSRASADRFVELDDALAGRQMEDRMARMSAFHDGHEYQVIIQAIFEGLSKIGEPHAKEKLRVIIEELGTMGPGVFLSPWEMTIDYLDRTVGSMEDVERFHT